MLSILGMGAMGDPDTVPLIDQMTADSNPTIQIVCALALGAINARPAVDPMLHIILSGSDLSRRAVAEMLAVSRT